MKFATFSHPGRRVATNGKTERLEAMASIIVVDNPERLGI